jgi:protein associated with RNAse G/E
MWNPGEVIAWRGIFNNRVWHVQPTIVVKDSPDELVLTLLPGAECVAEETYPAGKRHGKRWWNFINTDWKLAKYTWRTNRLLLILEPQQYFSTMLFWDHLSDEFTGYYINFQLPFERSHCGIDTLDLDLDIIIDPDFSFEWKDVEDYQKAIKHGLISAKWIQGIEAAKPEIFGKLEKRQYPFDGSWLEWRPDPSWEPPSLPENWDKI